MKLLVLVLALIAGSAGTSHAQVFKPRGKGPLLKKVDLKTPAPADAKKPDAAAPVAAAKADPKAAKAKPGSRVARDSRPDDLTPAPVKKKKTTKKRKKAGDDDDVKVSDDDDDVKVSDD